MHDPNWRLSEDIGPGTAHNQDCVCAKNSQAAELTRTALLSPQASSRALAPGAECLASLKERSRDDMASRHCGGQDCLRCGAQLGALRNCAASTARCRSR